MQIIIDIPMTNEEIKKEFEEQTEDFRRSGLLPIERDDFLEAESEVEK